MHAPPSAWDLEDTHREAPAAAASGAGARSSGSRRPPSCPARSTGGSGPAGCREGERSGGEGGRWRWRGRRPRDSRGHVRKSRSLPTTTEGNRGTPGTVGQYRPQRAGAGPGGVGRSCAPGSVATGRGSRLSHGPQPGAAPEPRRARMRTCRRCRTVPGAGLLAPRSLLGLESLLRSVRST